jgi:hypothetical protein
MEKIPKEKRRHPNLKNNYINAVRFKAVAESMEDKQGQP